MNKKFFTLMLIAGLCFTTAYAEDQDQSKKSSGVSGWLKSLQYKINQVVPKKTAPTTTGVAGIRGAKEDGQVKLYWKGRKGEEPVTEEEMKLFKDCIDLSEKGDNAKAVQQLEEFMKVYPDSALIPDAKKTLDMVKAETK